MIHQQLFPAPVTRHYRLINAALQPHPQLDDLYESLEAALEEAMTWCGNATTSHGQAFGVEVSTSRGDWRTVRYPQPLS